MSSPSLSVFVSPLAQEDYEDILLHSLLTWGEEQASDYEVAMDRVFQDLGTFPELGQAREDLFRGCRRHPVRQHVIYYRVDKTAVRIVRILHARMNPAPHLD